MHLTIILVAFLSTRPVHSADTCCYNKHCPAPLFTNVGFMTQSLPPSITAGSTDETKFKIRVSSCCPSGGYVWIHYFSAQSLSGACRCGGATFWTTQTCSYTESQSQACQATASESLCSLGQVSINGVPIRRVCRDGGKCLSFSLENSFASYPCSFSQQNMPQRCPPTVLCAMGISNSVDGEYYLIPNNFTDGRGIWRHSTLPTILYFQLVQNKWFFGTTFNSYIAYVHDSSLSAFNPAVASGKVFAWDGSTDVIQPQANIQSGVCPSKSHVPGRETCIYSPECPAPFFGSNLSTIVSRDIHGDGFIAHGSIAERNYAINVSACCPNSGWAYVKFGGASSLEGNCRCGDAYQWIPQSPANIPSRASACRVDFLLSRESSCGNGPSKYVCPDGGQCYWNDASSEYVCRYTSSMWTRYMPQRCPPRSLCVSGWHSISTRFLMANGWINGRAIWKSVDQKSTLLFAWPQTLSIPWDRPVWVIIRGRGTNHFWNVTQNGQSNPVVHGMYFVTPFVLDFDGTKNVYVCPPPTINPSSAPSSIPTSTPITSRPTPFLINNESPTTSGHSKTSPNSESTTSDSVIGVVVLAMAIILCVVCICGAVFLVKKKRNDATNNYIQLQETHVNAPNVRLYPQSQH